LMNILIAYLSNEYSRMEDRQVIEGLQTKASLCLDIEVVIALFKRSFSSRFRRLAAFRDSQYNSVMRRWSKLDHHIVSETKLEKVNYFWQSNLQRKIRIFWVMSGFWKLRITSHLRMKFL
jgi:hypothetical protein